MVLGAMGWEDMLSQVMEVVAVFFAVCSIAASVIAICTVMELFSSAWVFLPVLVFAFLDMIYFQIFRTTRGVGRLAIYCSPGVSVASQAVLCAFEVTVSAGASFLFLFLAWEFCVGYDGVVEPPWVPLHRHLIATCILFLIKGLVAVLLMAFSMYSGMRSIRTNRRVQLSDPRNDILLVSSSESSYREGMPSYAGNAAQSTALRSEALVREAVAIEASNNLADEESVTSPAWRQQLNKNRIFHWGFSLSWLVAFWVLLLWSAYDVVTIFFVDKCGADECHTECHPLATSTHTCMFPFPSMVWETPTGLNVPSDVLPMLRTGRRLNMAKKLESYDGWSPETSILFELPGFTAPSNGMAVNASVLPTSPTLILRAATGELVAHTTELDYLSSPLDVGVIQPMEPLRLGERYIVVVRNFTNTSGDLLPAPPAFALLWREAQAPGVADEGLVAHYRELVLPVLLNQTFMDLDVVQLCWDFTVRSEKSLSRRAAMRNVSSWLHQREEMSKAAPWNFNFKVHWREERQCTNTRAMELDLRQEESDEYALLRSQAATLKLASEQYAQVVWGSMTVPRLLASDARDGDLAPGLVEAILNASDAKAMEEIFGDSILENVPVVICVPCSISQEKNVIVENLLFYGHGLFNSRREIFQPQVERQTNALRTITLATDWRGLSRFDLPVFLKAFIRNPELLAATEANLMQGQISQAALLAWARSSNGNTLEKVLAGSASSQHITVNLAPEMNFWGISAGGILGGGLVTSYVSYTRAILGAAGIPFSLILARSDAFTILNSVMKCSVYHPVSVRTVLGLVQLFFDETTAVASTAVRDPYLTPRILLQDGLGDSTVTPISLENLGRSMRNCAAFESEWSVNPHGESALYGIARHNTSTFASGPCMLTQVRYSVPYAKIPQTDQFPPRTKVHSCFRVNPYLMLQTYNYLTDGNFTDVCMYHNGASHCIAEESYIDGQCSEEL